MGAIVPFVLFVSNAFGEVTLQFNNAYTGAAFFEYRLDGVGRTSGNAHPVVIGDFINPGVYLTSAFQTSVKKFEAANMVEVRLALGGERDWDFDWTAFKVATSVPEPASMLLLGFGLIGLAGAAARRKK